MNHITHQGERLAFDVAGPEDAPGVVLQHPLCSEPGCFDETTLRARLLRLGYRVLRPTSIAHGLSGVPKDDARYALKSRAQDVVALMDHVGMPRAAFVGYSMGTWIGCGVLAHHPERLTCAALGGFDVERGAHSCGIPLNVTRSALGRVLLSAYAMWPESRVTLGEHSMRALQRCFVELYEPMPGLDAMADVPLMLWSAKHDFYRPHMQRSASRLGVPCHVLSGHHFSASTDEAFVPLLLDHIQTHWPHSL